MSDDLATLQFEEDFESPTSSRVRTSTTVRPDAISLDYRTAYSVGPKDIADLTEGYESRVWYARADVDVVYLARADDANKKWESERTLLTFDGAQILELGLAFNKNGYPFLTMERPSGAGGKSEIWIYFKDPALL